MTRRKDGPRKGLTDRMMAMEDEMATIISSQRHIDDEIVAEKQACKDYTVVISPEFELCGRVYQVVLDGHHSLAAARADGCDPVFVEATEQDSDNVALLHAGNVNDFLAATWMGDNYYDVTSGVDVW